MGQRKQLYLDNDALMTIYERTKEYETTVREAFYEQYKIAYKVSKSNYFKGEAADAFKKYISEGAVNSLTGIMDLVSEVAMVGQMLAEGFLLYETDNKGKIDTEVLDYINETLKSKEKIYNETKTDLNKTISAASKYISVKKLQLDLINDSYTLTNKAVKRIGKDLIQLDNEAASAVEELYERIIGFKSLINNIKEYCYKDDRLDANKISGLKKQYWYEKQSNVTLYLMLQEDPFEYATGEVTVKEDQWAAGLCSDVYAYAGYSWGNGSYEVGKENGTVFAKGQAHVFEANAYGQVTKYLSASAGVTFLGAKGDAKAGWSEEYKGFHVNGEAAIVDASGSVIIGPENLNLTLKGDAKVLAADGKVAFEFEDGGEFAIGAQGSATLASASVEVELEGLGAKAKNRKTKESATLGEGLFGIKAKAGASAGVGAGAFVESKTVIEMENYNVNTLNVHLDLEILGDVEVDITVPWIFVK